MKAVEKGIPAPAPPPRRGGRRGGSRHGIYPWTRMAVGDSFIAPAAVAKHSIGLVNMAYAPKRFTARTGPCEELDIPEGKCRIWRVGDDRPDARPDAPRGSMANPSPYDCLGELSPEEPYFVLRAQDPAAPGLVEMFAYLYSGQTRVALQKLEEIAALIAAMPAPPRPAGTGGYRECFLISDAMERWRRPGHRKSAAGTGTGAR